jgi:hypothetical protein
MSSTRSGIPEGGHNAIAQLQRVGDTSDEMTAHDAAPWADERPHRRENVYYTMTCRGV